MKIKRKILSGVIGLLYAVCTTVVPVSAADNAIPEEEELAAVAATTTTEAAATTAATTTTAAATTATTAATEAATTSATTTATNAASELSEREKIDDYINNKLLYDPKAVLESKENLIAGDQTAKMEYSFAPNGDLIGVYKEKTTEDLSFDTFSVITLGEDNRNIFPGSMIYADERLITGDPKPIELDRAPTKMTILYAPMKAGTSRSTEYTPNAISDSEDAINLIQQNFDLSENRDFPAQIYYKTEKIETKEQMKAKLNISESFWGKLNIDVSAANQNNHSLYVAELNQIYYTVEANRVPAEKAFADNVTLEKVKSKITEKDAPAVISSVSYGRKILVTVECDDSSLDIQAALDASFASLKANAGFTYNSAYDHCSFKMLAYGGTSRDAGKFMTCNFNELKQAFSETTQYKDGCAIQLCYTTRFLKGDEIAAVHYVGDRWETKSSVARSAMDLDIQMDYDLKAIDPTATCYTMVYGKRLESMDKDGTIKYSDKEELLVNDFREYAGKRTYKIRGDIDPASIRIVAVNKGKYGTVLSYSLLPLDETLSDLIPRTKKIGVYYFGRNYEDEEDAWRTRSVTEIGVSGFESNGKTRYLGNVYYESWSKDTISLYTNGHYYDLSYTEPQIKLQTPETTTPTAETTTVTTTTTTSESTTPISSANDVLTTAASSETTNNTTTSTVAENTTPASSANDILTTEVASSETTTTTTETVNTDNWFASLTDFEEMALKDYEQKNGKRPAKAEASLVENGTVRIVLLDNKDGKAQVVAIYYVDPITGKGYDNKDEPVNLPQTGNNVPTAVAATSIAILMISVGCIMAMKSGVSRKEGQ